MLKSKKEENVRNAQINLLTLQPVFWRSFTLVECCTYSTISRISNMNFKQWLINDRTFIHHTILQAYEPITDITYINLLFSRMVRKKSHFQIATMCMIFSDNSRLLITILEKITQSTLDKEFFYFKNFLEIALRTLSNTLQTIIKAVKKNDPIYLAVGSNETALQMNNRYKDELEKIPLDQLLINLGKFLKDSQSQEWTKFVSDIDKINACKIDELQAFIAFIFRQSGFPQSLDIIHRLAEYKNLTIILDILSNCKIYDLPTVVIDNLYFTQIVQILDTLTKTLNIIAEEIRKPSNFPLISESLNLKPELFTTYSLLEN